MDVVVNGGFDTDTVWNKEQPGWTISGGVAVADGTAGNPDLTQSGILTSGTTYDVTLDVTVDQVSLSTSCSPHPHVL